MKETVNILLVQGYWIIFSPNLSYKFKFSDIKEIEPVTI